STSHVIITPLTSSFFFSSRRRHTRFSRDWSSDVCSSDLLPLHPNQRPRLAVRASLIATARPPVAPRLAPVVWIGVTRFERTTRRLIPSPPRSGSGGSPTE